MNGTPVQLDCRPAGRATELAKAGPRDTGCVTSAREHVTQRITAIQQSSNPGNSTQPTAGGGSRRQKSKAEALEELIRLPLPQFIASAFEEARLHDHDTDADWQNPRLFWFTYLLRGHRDFEKHLAKPSAALQLVEKHLRQWTEGYRQGNDQPEYGFTGDPWGDWFGINPTDAREEFCDLWGRIRYRPGHGPIEQAIEANRRTPLRLLDKHLEKHPPENPATPERSYQFFVGVAGWLQVAMGDRAIALPCNKLAQLLSVSPMTISRWIRSALKDELLVQVAFGQFRSKGTGKAAEFRFAVHYFPILREKAQA